jgi:hypothetical protein
VGFTSSDRTFRIYCMDILTRGIWLYKHSGRNWMVTGTLGEEKRGNFVPIFFFIK